MPERRRSRTFLAVLTLVALVLITLDYRQGDDGPLEAVRRGALIVFAPVQDGFARVVRPIGGVGANVRELASLRDRNRALEEEITELEGRMPSVTDLERENAELRALLGMSERHDLETTAGRIIGQPPGERSNTVLIDTGADAGVQTGMAVVSSRGLVGKIIETTPRYARVELLTSPTAHYAVRIAGTGETGLLRGRGAEPFQLELLDPEVRAAEGAQVVTRTFEGSTIPDGLPVGEVVDDREAEGQTSPRFHLVRPFVDFRRLSVVQVVLDAPEPPEVLDPDDLIEPPEGDRPREDAPDDDDNADGENADGDGDGEGEDGNDGGPGGEGSDDGPGDTAAHGDAAAARA